QTTSETMSILRGFRALMGISSQNDARKVVRSDRETRAWPACLVSLQAGKPLFAPPSRSAALACGYAAGHRDHREIARLARGLSRPESRREILQQPWIVANLLRR